VLISGIYDYDGKVLGAQKPETAALGSNPGLGKNQAY
jgi:hypothetical protein